MRFEKKYQAPSGFSLIELLIAITIFSLVVIVVITFQKDVFSLNGIISDSLNQQNSARKIIKSVAAEIRAAATSNTGAYPLSQTNADSIIFYSDIDNDNLKERVRYFADGATFKKGVVKPTGSPPTYNLANEIIQESISSITNGTMPIFEYYDTDYDGNSPSLTAPFSIDRVRLVKINIKLDIHVNRLPKPIILTTQVSIRNLKDNL